MPPRRSVAALLVAILAASALSGCIGSLVPSTGFGANWPAKMVGVDALHDRGLTGKGVKVAVIDTGIDLSHPEFAGVTVLWADLVNGRSDKPYDDNGHGTHVAGIIAAQGEWTTSFSGFYLKGIAPKVTLIAIKAIAADGTGDESKVAAGIDAAVKHGADVIVLSLGGESGFVFSTDTEEAVDRAVAKGVYVVAAAGNAKKDQTGSSCRVASPASVDGVIAVGAVDKRAVIGSFSCMGSCNNSDLVSRARSLGECSRGYHGDPNQKPEIVAPGVSILSAWKEGKYVEATGTSQSAPVVGGILALALEANKDLVRKDRATVMRVKDALMGTAKKVGPLEGQTQSAHDAFYGYGLIDGVKLVDRLRR
ncbi:MAG TPA: S8 family serine peptidase [Candidatus Thermoplasmatota archaeon]|nr:S8 family serine peptidase [Candidatus Thermoplasmatota archaeon]